MLGLLKFNQPLRGQCDQPYCALDFPFNQLLQPKLNALSYVFFHAPDPERCVRDSVCVWVCVVVIIS